MDGFETELDTGIDWVGQTGGWVLGGGVVWVGLGEWKASGCGGKNLEKARWEGKEVSRGRRLEKKIRLRFLALSGWPDLPVGFFSHLLVKDFRAPT